MILCDDLFSFRYTTCHEIYIKLEHDLVTYHSISWSIWQFRALCWDTLWYRAPCSIVTDCAEVGGWLELCQALD